MNGTTHTTKSTESDAGESTSWISDQDPSVLAALGLGDEDVSATLSAFALDLEMVARGMGEGGEGSFFVDRMAARAHVIQRVAEMKEHIAARREHALTKRVAELEAHVQRVASQEHGLATEVADVRRQVTRTTRAARKAGR